MVTLYPCQQSNSYRKTFSTSIKIKHLHSRWTISCMVNDHTIQTEPLEKGSRCWFSLKHFHTVLSCSNKSLTYFKEVYTGHVQNIEICDIYYLCHTSRNGMYWGSVLQMMVLHMWKKGVSIGPVHFTYSLWSKVNRVGKLCYPTILPVLSMRESLKGVIKIEMQKLIHWEFFI